MCQKYFNTAAAGGPKAGMGKGAKPVKSEVWDEIRKLVEDGVPCARAARTHQVSVSAVYTRARREAWQRPVRPKAPAVKPACANGEDPAEALDACQRAVTRALMRAAQGLMHAETDISKAMEPVDRALKLKRELTRESREQGSTTVVVETLVPEPQAPSEEE